jgi:hypothetical protein
MPENGTKLAELIGWDELENDYAAHSARVLVLQKSHFFWRWGP